MTAFLQQMTLIINTFIQWISTLSSWMANDILVGFALALTVFGVVLRIFRKIKKII